MFLAIPRVPVCSNRRYLQLACACLALVLPTVTNAATYYASPSGSDSNPGTYSQPFRTVARGLQAVTGGDTIVLQDGTYPADTPYGGGSTSGWLLWIAKSGSPGAPITLKAEHKQKAILDCGNGYSQGKTGCMGYIFLGNPGPSYWIFQDLVFTRSYDIALLLNSSTPGHDITVKGCRFEDIGRHVTAQTTGMDGVYANEGHYNLTFDGNVFANIGRLPGSTYMFNDHALYLHSSNSTVTNNVFYGSISGWGVQTASGFSGLIANNTFAFTAPNTGGQVMLWDNSGAITVQNNIFYQPPSGFAVNTCALTSPSCTLDHNLVYGGSIGGAAGCGASASVCSASSTMSGNPMLASPVSAPFDFHLLGGSAAIDTGANAGVGTDYDGVARPQGGGRDVGAFEYLSSLPPAISNVTVASITSNSATIVWNTDKPADSQVLYGVSGYSSTTPRDGSMVTYHSATLSNLSASTTYHFAVSSRDGNGTPATSSDFSFTTAPAPIIPPLSLSLSLSAPSVTVPQGQTSTVGLTVALLTGLSQTVSFSAAGLPSSVSATFSPATCLAPCLSVMTLSASTTAPEGTYALSVVTTAGSVSASSNLTMTVAGQVNSGLVASWNFSEGGGYWTSDSSGNNNAGLLSGNAGWTGGGGAMALWLDGNGSYVSVNESPSLQLYKNITVAFWIYANDVPGVDQRIISKNYSWDIKLNGRSHIPQFSSGSNYASLNYALPMGSWQHVVFTMNSGTVRGYVNGVLISALTDTFKNNFVFPNYQYGLYLGTDSSRTSSTKGALDDVRIYNRPLTPAEVASLYSSSRH